MSLLSKIIIGILFCILPIVIGSIWVLFFCKNLKKKTFAEYIKLLIQAWIYGFMSMLAVMQLIAIPMIIKRTYFSTLAYVWYACIAVMTVCGIVCIFKIVQKLRCIGKDASGVKINKMTIVLGIAVIILVAGQARISAKYQHTDDDDARFVALELIAVERDEMLLRSPIDGNPMYWNVGEVKKDYTSPWTMYVAACSKISSMPPAVLSHRMLPMILIPMCYLAYMLLGLNIFKGDYEKTLVFLLIVSIVNIFGYTSTHTISSLLLLRIWQGKAVYAGLGIPVIFTVLYELYDNPDSVVYQCLLTVVSLAVSLLSGGGIVITIIAIGIYGIVMLVRYRRPVLTAKIWLTCTPCIVYSICNVFWYQIFAVS